MAEIEDLILSYKRRQTVGEKLKIEQLFTLADAIGTRVAFLFTGKEDQDSSKIMQPWDVYPELFAEDKEIAEKYREEIEFEKYKEARKRHAMEFNKRRVD